MVIHRLLPCAAVAAVCASLAHAQGPAGVEAGARDPQQITRPIPQAQTGPRCRVEGHVTSGQGVLPGASVVVHLGDALKAATSTDIDGKYAIVFAPNATYHVSADLTAFTLVERDVTLAAPPCDTTVDFQLTLKPRHEPLTTTASAEAMAAGATRSQPAAAPRLRIRLVARRSTVHRINCVRMCRSRSRRSARTPSARPSASP